LTGNGIAAVDYGRPGGKAARTRELVHRLLLEHDDDGGIPTNNRFVFYELEQRGDATKPSPDDPRPNRNRSIGWPPGRQDVNDALMWLRDDAAIVPWSWIDDETRTVAVWPHAPTVAAYLRDRLAGATINPWGDEDPPLILCESKATAGVLRSMAAAYACPITGTAGQAGGFLRTEIAPLLMGNDRRVRYLGDLDRCGGDIEGNTRRVLEREAGRELDWHRLGMTEEQAEGIAPIWKVDSRDGNGHWAWEVEALGQAGVVALVRAALDELLPEPLERVQERERVERAEMAEALARLNGGTS
jgi:hypothetical protein